MKAVTVKRTALTEADRERVINDFLPFIKYTAYRLTWRLPPHLTVKDLISVGIIGLLEALSRYRDGEVKINTFVEYRIRGAMLDELRAHDPLSKSMKKKITTVKRVYAGIEKNLGRAPEPEEVAEALNIDLDEYYRIIQHSHAGVTMRLEAFENRNHEDSDVSLSECIPDDNAKTPLEIYEENDMKKALAEQIDKLPEREKILLSLYYQDEMTMKEIGKVLNLTEGRVCQLHSQAINRLKAGMGKRSSG
jgi:RNA polymerase sigma factor FliA